MERLAILYPKTYNNHLVNAYSRLEFGAYRLKEQRPWLRIIERLELQTVLDEQRLELSGGIADDSAAHVGRLLGVDGILLYRVQGPTLRDQMMARFTGAVPPVIISTKIVLVQTGEVVYHNVVTAPVDPPTETFASIRTAAIMDEAFDRGINQTLADLVLAFR